MTASAFTSNVASTLNCNIATKRWRDVQVAIKFDGTFTAGSIAWTMTPIGGTPETITVDGVALTTTPSDTRSFIIDKAILDSVTATPTGIEGTAENFTVTICGVLDSDR